MANGRDYIPRENSSRYTKYPSRWRQTTVKGMESNALAMLVVAYHLVAFDSSSYWSSSMFSTAALSGGVNFLRITDEQLILLESWSWFGSEHLQHFQRSVQLAFSFKFRKSIHKCFVTANFQRICIYLQQNQQLYFNHSLNNDRMKI